MISTGLLFLCVLVADSVSSSCPPDAKYRSIDGRCNNVDNEFWGAAGQPYERMVPAEYDDGSFMPRSKGIGNKDLPNPRNVSVEVHKGTENLASEDSVMVMQWGQFLDHDMTLTPMMVSDVKCCNNFVSGNPHADIELKRACFPIGIPAGDRQFKNCMEFKRSKAFMYSDPREQINKITGFIDASAVYGSSDKASDELRNGAYMKTSRTKNLLPESTTFECIKKDPLKEWCFAAGDTRVNVFPGLSLLHTIFVREHNRIVNELKKILPDSTTDDVFYQEARKVISALIQQITYGEYLPLVLGPHAMKKYKLGLDEDFVYNPKLNPTNFNVFATAALRFGHSAVPRSLLLDRKSFLPFSVRPENIHIEHTFKTNAELINNLEDVVWSMLNRRQEKADLQVTSGMTDHLFETAEEGFDIVSLNIQRGRDHGLPGYNAFRTYCKLPNVTSFSDPEPFGKENGELLSKVYDSPYDVDVFTGGLAEKHVHRGGVGPLFACLLGVQFMNVKFGDSFWYQRTDSKKGFTEAQLKEIRKVTLSKLLCDNTELTQIRTNSFEKKKLFWFNEDMIPIPCECHGGINFTMWTST